jgi:electron transfer flavoprotein alpha subunit
MTLSKIWVYAQAAEGKVTTLTLELLTKARELADTVEAVYGGADADAIAGQLGEHGATTVHATGDLGAPSRVCRSRRPSPQRSRPATAPTPSCSAPATTAATSPAACRPSSTSRSSPTWSTSSSTATPSSAPSRSSVGPPT